MKFITLFACLMISACSSSVSKKPKLPEKIVNNDLVGAWELLYDGRGDYWFSHVGFNRAGEKCTISYRFDNNNALTANYYLSTYDVKNNELTVKVVNSSTSFIEVGQVIKDNLLSFSKNKFEMLMHFPVAGSSIDRFTKLNGVDADSICKVVKKQFHKDQ